MRTGSLTLDEYTERAEEKARRWFSPVSRSGNSLKNPLKSAPRFCYNMGVSLCSHAGVKNPRWQGDT